MGYNDKKNMYIYVYISVKMLYKLELKVPGFWLLFGCWLVTIHHCHNVSGNLHFYVVTMQRCDNQKTTL